MNRELRSYVLFIGLPALMFAGAGLLLSFLEADHAREDAREAAETRAETAVAAFDARVKDALSAERLAAEPFDAAFTWIKGTGVVERIGAVPAFRGDFKWIATGRRSKSPKRGWFETNGVTCVWTRISPDLVRGAVLSSSPEPLAGRPSFVLGAGICFAGVLALALLGGGYSLLRSVRRARAEALAKTSFVSNVSHELRTPLAAIELWSGLLEEGACTTPEKQAHALGVISGTCAKMNALVDNLLDFSRRARGRRRYEVVRVPLAEAARAAAEEVRRTFPDFRAVVPDSDLAARADASAVASVLRNLYENAAKYAPGAPAETAFARSATGGVSVAVRDRGTGLVAADYAHLFEEFWRKDDSTAKQTGGFGLGLALARGLARDMGGDLTAAPCPDGGARFTLTLPEEA